MAIPQRLCKKEGQEKEREREKVKREKRGDRTEGRCSTLEMWGGGGGTDGQDCEPASEGREWKDGQPGQRETARTEGERKTGRQTGIVR